MDFSTSSKKRRGGTGGWGEGCNRKLHRRFIVCPCVFVVTYMDDSPSVSPRSVFSQPRTPSSTAEAGTRNGNGPTNTLFYVAAVLKPAPFK